MINNRNDSFNELAAGIVLDLYKFIFTIVRNKYLADDVIQESLMKGFKSYDSLKDISKFKSWMFTIAKREALRILTKNKREVLTEKDDMERIIDRSKWYGISINNDTKDKVVEIINKLDSESKDIILLIYFNELSLEEAASVLNINYNTMKSKHKRIKEKIYKELTESHLIHKEAK